MALFKEIAIDPNLKDLKSISNIQIYGSDIVNNLINNLSIFIGPIATIVLLIAGFMFVTSTSQDRTDTARNIILGTLGALILIGLIKPIEGFFQSITSGDIVTLYDSLTMLIKDVFTFAIQTLSTLSSIVAVFLLILAGYQLIFSFGDEDKISSAKKSAIGVLFSLLIIAIAQTFLSTVFGDIFKPESVAFGAKQISNLTVFIVDIINFALSLAGITAVAMIIYAGYKALLAGEGDTGDARKIITHALIGIVIIMASFAITNVVYNLIF